MAGCTHNKCVRGRPVSFFNIVAETPDGERNVGGETVVMDDVTNRRVCAVMQLLLSFQQGRRGWRRNSRQQHVSDQSCNIFPRTHFVMKREIEKTGTKALRKINVHVRESENVRALPHFHRSISIIPSSALSRAHDMVDGSVGLQSQSLSLMSLRGFRS